LRVSQLGIAIVGAPQTGLPCFGNFIGHVVVIGSKEEMLWIDASPIVAPMQDLRAVWDWSTGHFPHQSMCQCQFSIPYLAVSRGIDRCRPLMATTAVAKCGRDLVDLGPKATL
jgi:hypothetical protein